MYVPYYVLVPGYDYYIDEKRVWACSDDEYYASGSVKAATVQIPFLWVITL
jgi:PDZ domain-containing secreted protein